jgi:hypothetical protein
VQEIVRLSASNAALRDIKNRLAIVRTYLNSAPNAVYDRANLIALVDSLSALAGAVGDE